MSVVNQLSGNHNLSTVFDVFDQPFSLLIMDFIFSILLCLKIEDIRFILTLLLVTSDVY